MKTIVAIERCADYDQSLIDLAVKKTCDAAGFPDASGKTVLLKPNILKGASPDEAVSTHPSILRAAIRYAKTRGAARVQVGESPAFQVGTAAFKKSGLLEAATEEGAEWVDFLDSVQVENPQGKVVRNFTVARAAKEADILVSLCKLKTHQLMYFTGAMKNLFGTVPGLQKSQFHLRFPDRERFGQMLTDLNLAVRSHFSLMDAIVGMEGPGPGSGYPRGLGLVLASRDPLALDMTACRAIGLDPHLVANLKDALGRDAWIGSEEEIELLGPAIAEVAVADWKHVPRQGADRKVPAALRNLFVSRPFFSRTKCSACKACVTICPGAALELVPDPQARAKKSVRVNYDKCIRCYCCHEVCGDEAIVVKRWRPLGFA
ncbi:MAG TPA: DUF362 domain-containing protein [Rectinemataceae bacterium]|nr:DUF362 domain-containing protein [Rectinemataceae bacterium]